MSDAFACQWCGREKRTSDALYEHVVRKHAERVPEFRLGNRSRNAPVRIRESAADAQVRIASAEAARDFAAERAAAQRRESFHDQPRCSYCKKTIALGDEDDNAVSCDALPYGQCFTHLNCLQKELPSVAAQISAGEDCTHLCPRHYQMLHVPSPSIDDNEFMRGSASVESEEAVLFAARQTNLLQFISTAASAPARLTNYPSNRKRPAEVLATANVSSLVAPRSRARVGVKSAAGAESIEAARIALASSSSSNAANNASSSTANSNSIKKSRSKTMKTINRRLAEEGDKYIVKRKVDEKDKLPGYFCIACEKQLGMNSVLKRHVESQAHQKKKEAKELTLGGATPVCNTQSIHEAIRRASTGSIQTAPSRKVDFFLKAEPTLAAVEAADTNGELVAKFKIVHALLENGIPLARLDNATLRSVLIKPDGATLPETASSYHKLVPSVREFLFEFDRKQIAQRRGEKFMALYFDGTTDVAECFAIVAFYFDGEYKVLHRRLLKLQYVAKPLTGDELAQLCNHILSDLNALQSIICYTHDRCTVNNAAMRTMSSLSKPVADIQCISHTIANVGDAIELQERDALCNTINEIFSRSKGHAKAAWKSAQNDQSATWQGKSMVRWFSKHEMCKRICLAWASLPTFFDKMEEHAKSLVTRCRRLLQSSTVTIAVQMAVGVDVGDVLVRYCYGLEGEKLIAHVVFRVLQQFFLDWKKIMDGDVTSFPNTRAICARYQYYQGEERPAEDLFDYAKSKLVKSNNMLKKTLFDTTTELTNLGGRDFESDILLYMAIELIDPRVARVIPSAAVARSRLRYATWLTDVERDNLAEEFTAYKACALGETLAPLPKDALAFDEDVLKIMPYWKAKRDHFHNWFRFAMQALLVFPSSAPVERLFATLDRLFKQSQESTLEDIREASVKASFDSHRKV